MKALQLRAYSTNPADVISLVDLPSVGAPAAGEVIIDIEAAPIEPSDLYMMMGVYGNLPTLPHVLGIQGVGRVSAVGQGVKHLKEGDRTITPPFVPTWQGRVRGSADWLSSLPDGDVSQLSMLGINPATAYLLMEEYVKLNPGDWIVQNSSNSGVGRAVIAIAKARGIHTVNIVRRAELADELTAKGADVVLVEGPDLIQRIKAATGNAPIALAIDGVGGAATQDLLNVLPKYGTVAVYSGMSGAPLVASPPGLVFFSHSIRAFWIFNHFLKPDHQKIKAMYEELAPLVASGAYALPIAGTYRFDQFAEAIDVAGKYNGKAIFVPGANDR